MAFLILLAPLLHSENPELPREFRARSEQVAAAELAALGATAKVEWPKNIPAPIGASIYEWKGGYDAVLAISWWFEHGAAKAPFLRSAALIRREDCVVMGQVLAKVEGPAPQGFPESIFVSKVTLSEASLRTFQSTSTFKFQTMFRGDSRERFAHVTEAIGSEMLAARGIPVNASFQREGCTQKSETQRLYPSRTHRLLRLEFTAAEPKAPNFAKGRTTWPKVRGRLAILSGIFGQDTEAKDAPWGEPNWFDPKGLVETAMPRVDASRHDVSAIDFKVTKRAGRWLYLDRGRAYGLEIGMHLVGPRGSKMHVIHFDPGEKGADVAVAMLRREADGAPIGGGDAVSVDPTIYPPR